MQPASDSAERLPSIVLFPGHHRTILARFHGSQLLKIPVQLETVTLRQPNRPRAAMWRKAQTGSWTKSGNKVQPLHLSHIAKSHIQISRKI
jgi:hypothetical protein